MWNATTLMVCRRFFRWLLHFCGDSFFWWCDIFGNCVIMQVDVVRTRMMVQRRLQGGKEEGVRLYKSTIHCAYHTVSKVLNSRFKTHAKKLNLTLRIEIRWKWLKVPFFTWLCKCKLIRERVSKVSMVSKAANVHVYGRDMMHIFQWGVFTNIENQSMVLCADTSTNAKTDTSTNTKTDMIYKYKYKHKNKKYDIKTQTLMNNTNIKQWW